ncbi:MAG TPA: hypothetical protein VMA35_01860 [Candidatus Sulfopaludibacter sp.]|nr:hypothetical protein [Candidatus Sulfopaludibacter sp.]
MPVWPELVSTPKSKLAATIQTALDGWRLEETKNLCFVFMLCSCALDFIVLQEKAKRWLKAGGYEPLTAIPISSPFQNPVNPLFLAKQANLW